MDERTYLTVAPAKAIGFLGRFLTCTKRAVELRALPSKTRTFTRPPSKIRRFIEQHANENIYFGVATRESGGAKEHCREVVALWADIDFKDIPPERARELIGGFRVEPSLIVESGNGLHVYWLLDQPAAASDPRIEPILRGLARELSGDRAATEVARIMRLPGTLNYKYTPPRTCQVVEAHWEVRYRLPDFEKFEEKSRGTTSVESDGTEKFRQGHRNSSLMSIAGSLRHRGMDDPTIALVLMAVNRERSDHWGSAKVFLSGRVQSRP